MKNDRFLKRLKKDMPLWVERGWVKEEGEKAILDQAASQSEGGTRYLTMAFSILGVLLVASLMGSQPAMAASSGRAIVYTYDK